jgi:hypothetical protein
MVPFKRVKARTVKKKITVKAKTKEISYSVGTRPPGGKRISPIKESDVLQECRLFLERQKGIFWRRNEGGAKLFAGRLAKSECKGMPDLIVISGGVTYGIELKRPWGGKLSPLQAQCLCEMIKAGALAGVVTSVSGMIRMLQGLAPTCYYETQCGAVPAWH